MSNTYAIGVNKADELFDVDFGKLPESTQEFIISYGLRQYLNDAVAGVKDGATKEAFDKVSDRLAKMAAGTCTERGARESNPVKAEMKAQATKIVTEKLRAYAKKNSLKAEDILKAHLTDKVTEYLTKHEETLKASAEVVVEAKRAAKAAALAAEENADEEDDFMADLGK